MYRLYKLKFYVLIKCVPEFTVALNLRNFNLRMKKFISFIYNNTNYFLRFTNIGVLLRYITLQALVPPAAASVCVAMVTVAALVLVGDTSMYTKTFEK